MNETVSPAATAAALRAAMRDGRHMPAEWMGRLSLHDGYETQLALLALLEAEGERQAGWKVGLTAAAMRAQWRIPDPCFGFLLASGNVPSGHRFAFAPLIAPGFENELCLRIGTRLQGPGVTLAQAMAAVSHAAPALEIVEKRGPFSDDLALAMADNAQQKAFVTGAEIALTDANRDLSRATVEVFVNGTLIDSAPASAVMESSPYTSVQWLANALAAHGRALEPGQRIMAGSFTKQYPIAAGDHVVARFSPFGEVSARFD